MNLALGDKGPDIKIEPFAECQSSWKVVDSAKTKVAKKYEVINQSLQGSQCYAPEPWQGHEKTFG